MHFSIDDRIFQQFPGTMVGIVVAHDISNFPHESEIDQLAKKVHENLSATRCNYRLTAAFSY